jgi:hypothetical protein
MPNGANTNSTPNQLHVGGPSLVSVGVVVTHYRLVLNVLSPVSLSFTVSWSSFSLTGEKAQRSYPWTDDGHGWVQADPPSDIQHCPCQGLYESNPIFHFSIFIWRGWVKVARRHHPSTVTYTTVTVPIRTDVGCPGRPGRIPPPPKKHPSGPSLGFKCPLPRGRDGRLMMMTSWDFRGTGLRTRMMHTLY